MSSGAPQPQNVTPPNSVPRARPARNRDSVLNTMGLSIGNFLSDTSKALGMSSSVLTDGDESRSGRQPFALSIAGEKSIRKGVGKTIQKEKTSAEEMPLAMPSSPKPMKPVDEQSAV